MYIYSFIPKSLRINRGCVVCEKSLKRDFFFFCDESNFANCYISQREFSE